MNKRFSFIIFLLILSAFSAKAQVQVRGKITDTSTDNPIPFANVILLNSPDSTYYKGTVTDLEGTYHFDNVTIGRYILVVSYMGYEDVKESVRLVMPSSGNVWVKDFKLRESAYALSEVVVKGSRIAQHADHKSYTFSDADRKKALYARDLLTTLPDIRENPLSGKIESIQGGEPLILINGIKATEIELRSINPSKVKSVDYYDIPPARYAATGNVINVITSRLDNGFVVGAQTLTAVTTGFSNDAVYLSSSFGDHRLDLSYQLNYRNYKKRNTDINYQYMLGGLLYEDMTKGQENFGYTDHDLTLKYTFLKPEKQIFQATFSPTFSKKFSKGTHEGVYTMGDLHSDRERVLNDINNTISPIADLYYWLKTKSGDELTFNLHSTFFHTKGETDRHEYEIENNEEVYKDKMILNNRKTSIIGEVAYTRHLTFSMLNAGYKIEYAHLGSDISNLYGESDYTSSYLQQYIYGELVGSYKQFIYRLSLGLSHLYNKSYSNTYNKILFTPQAVAGYNFSSFTSLKLGLSRTPIIPNTNMLSNNAIIITPDIISTGNPNLISGSNTSAVLMASHSNKYINIATGFVYSYLDNPIEQSFLQEDGKIKLTYRNGKYAHHIGGKISLLIKPFGSDIFSINAFASPTWQILHTEDGIQRNLSVENFITATLSYKGWSLNYQYTIPTYSLNGAFLSLSENYNNLMLNYQYKQWKMTIGALFIGKDSHYQTKSLDNSIVTYTNNRNILDNKNMIVLGFEYSFNSGKNKEIERKIKNIDKIAPLF